MSSRTTGSGSTPCGSDRTEAEPGRELAPLPWEGVIFQQLVRQPRLAVQALDDSATPHCRVVGPMLARGTPRLDRPLALKPLSRVLLDPSSGVRSLLGALLRSPVLVRVSLALVFVRPTKLPCALPCALVCCPIPRRVCHRQANAPHDPDCIRPERHRTSPKTSAQDADCEEDASDYPESLLAGAPLL